jgi:riboflavin synthase
MFTGLVEDTGIVVSADRAAGASESVVLAIRPQRIPLAELAVGESICHDGACLTVTEICDLRGLGDLGGGTYRVLAGAETLARTALGALGAGQRVNLERALRVGDRLGGHWVTGHIDGTGELVVRRDLGANLVLGFRAAPAVLRYVVEKGSIAVAGVSLTVNAVDAETFSVAIIPHTRDHTNLGDLAVGDRVNLEADILAKHVEKLVKP